MCRHNLLRYVRISLQCVDRDNRWHLSYNNFALFARSLLRKKDLANVRDAAVENNANRCIVEYLRGFVYKVEQVEFRRCVRPFFPL